MSRHPALPPRRWLLAGLGALALLAGATAAMSTARASLGSLYSALTSERCVRLERGLAYGPGARHKLDVWRPLRDNPGGPVALFLYGGGWRKGERGMYGFVGAALAARGITTVIPDTRLFPETGFPGFVEDAAAAYAWARRDLAGGGRPMVLIGHSAGAHTAALLALDRGYLARAGVARGPAAVVGLAGPYSFDPTTWPSTREIFAGARSAASARPVSFARTDAPPMLLMHGTRDNVVKPYNQRDLAAALRAAGATVETEEPAGIGHTGLVLALSRPFRWRAPVLEQMLAFIGRHTGATIASRACE